METMILAAEPRLPFRLGPPALSEHALQALWHARPWGAIALRTRDGHAVRVICPGRWSQDGGPDFQQAVLEMDGRTVVGDVEVHLRASDWKAHGHSLDPAYARVALHVICEEDEDSRWTRGPGESRIPKVDIGAWVRRLIASAPRGLPEAAWLGPGACRGVSIEELRAFALQKGRERTARRAAEIAARAAATDGEQTAWEALAEGLGYARNAAPFLRLARRVPIADLRDRIAHLPAAERLLHAEGVLLGAAGLLPTDGGDDEARNRLRALQEAWFEHAEEWDTGGLRAGEWALGGMRPENQPVRRVAALAACAAASCHAHADGSPITVVSSHGRPAEGRSPKAESRSTPAPRSSAFVEAWSAAVEAGPDEVVRLLRVPADPFWAWRCGFGTGAAAGGSGRSLARPTALVGPDRALVLAVNALAPTVLALRAGLSARVQSLLAILPSPSSNRLTRLSGYRILGVSAPPPESALEEQGRLQLAAEGCQWGRDGCARCPLRRAH